MILIRRVEHKYFGYIALIIIWLIVGFCIAVPVAALSGWDAVGFWEYQWAGWNRVRFISIAVLSPGVCLILLCFFKRAEHNRWWHFWATLGCSCASMILKGLSVVFIWVGWTQVGHWVYEFRYVGLLVAVICWIAGLMLVLHYEGRPLPQFAVRRT